MMLAAASPNFQSEKSSLVMSEFGKDLFIATTPAPYPN